MIENKRNIQLGIKSVTYILDEELSQEAKNMITNLSIQEKIIDYTNLRFKRNKSLEFDFREYRSLKNMFKEIYYRKISIDKAEDTQRESKNLYDALEKYRPTTI